MVRNVLLGAAPARVTTGCAARMRNNQPFKQSCLDQSREMIRINRNHPSIIMWSMGNELWFGMPHRCPIGFGVALLRRMIAVAHVEDSTRPAGVGGVQLNTAQLSAPCDVVGFNGGMTTAEMLTAFPHGIGIRKRRIAVAMIEAGNYFACYGRTDDGHSFPRSLCGVRARFPLVRFLIMEAIAVDTRVPNDGMINNARLVQKRWYFYRNLYLGTAPPTWPVSRDRGQAQIDHRPGHHNRRRQKRRAAHRSGAGRLGKLAVEYTEHHADRPVGTWARSLPAPPSPLPAGAGINACSMDRRRSNSAVTTRAQ